MKVTILAINILINGEYITKFQGVDSTYPQYASPKKHPDLALCNVNDIVEIRAVESNGNLTWTD